MPARLAAFHKSLGQLRYLLLTAELITDGATEKLDKSSIRPLNLTAEAVISGYNSATTPRQFRDSMETKPGNKECSQAQYLRGLPPKPSTGLGACGKRVNGERTEAYTLKTYKDKPVESWTTEEWLRDLETALGDTE